MVHSIFLHFVTPFSNSEKLSSHNLYYTSLFEQPVYNQYPIANMKPTVHRYPPSHLGSVKLLWATITTPSIGHAPYVTSTHILHAEPLSTQIPPYDAQAPKLHTATPRYMWTPSSPWSGNKIPSVGQKGR